MVPAAQGCLMRSDLEIVDATVFSLIAEIATCARHPGADLRHPSYCILHSRRDADGIGTDA